MEKKIAPKEKPQMPAIYQNEQPEIIRTDIIVPYIVCCQGQSESVQQRKAQLGDIVRSTNFEKVGSTDEPVEVIFLHYPKANWIVEKKLGQKFEYVRTEPRNAKNETDAWSFWCDEDGNELVEQKKGAIEYRRVKQLLVFAILPRDIEAANIELKKIEEGELPDPSKALTPVLMSFRSTSYKAGKEVCTFFTKAASMNVPIWKYALGVTNTLEKNDDGSFYVWKVDQVKPKAVHKANLPLIERWVSIVSSGSGLHADENGDGVSSSGSRQVNNERVQDVC